MAVYLLRRLGLFALGLLVASVVVFLVLRVLPGDVAQVVGGVTATPERVARIRADLGLDRPLPAQYLGWLGGALRGDLGTSLVTGAPVWAELGAKMQVTAPLCGLGLLVAALVGLPLGVWAGLRPDGRARWLVQALAQAAAAVPVLWAGLLLVLLVGRGVGLVGLLPSQGFPRDGWADPAGALQALVLPALTIGVVEGALLLRFTRSAVLEAAPQDYIRTAAAVGLTRTQAIVRHGLPNVSLSLLSVLGLQAASLVTGAVLVEQLFALPGVGSMLVGDVGNRDLAKVQGEIVALTALVLLIGLAVDVALRVVDPRQRRAVAA